MTACSTGSKGIDPEALIPSALTTCKDAPAVPDRPAPNQPRTDEQKGAYVVDLREAFLDCKGVVHSVAVRRQEMDAQYAGKPMPKVAPAPATVTAQPAPAAATPAVTAIPVTKPVVTAVAAKKPWWRFW